MTGLPWDSILRRAFIALGALVVGTVSVFSQQKIEVPASRFFIDPTLEQLTVAEVGPLSISGLEFKLGFEFGPAFPKRVRDSKSRYLTFLIYEKLLALDAQRRGLDQWPDVKRQIAEIQADLATEELYKQDVLGKVHVTDRQLTRSMEEAKVNLTLQWIYCRSASEVDDVVREIKAGVPFDSLFVRQFEGGVTRVDRSVETTVFRLRMKNPFFAVIVDSIDAGTVSLPVHGPDGWYIVRMAGRWTNPIVTQSDQAKLQEDVRRALTQHVADSLSDRYVRNLIGSKNPVIEREQFNAIQAFLASKFLIREKVEEWKIDSRTGAKELEDVSNLESIADKTLVEAKTGNLVVRDFLEWYRMREPYVKMELASPRVFLQSTEELVWRMVRDRLLTREAYARGFQNMKSVKQQTHWWKEKMLYTANKNRIADTIVDSLELVRKYYDEHKRSFQDEKGVAKPFETVYDDVKQQYYSSELTKRLLHEILRLKQMYGVTTNESALERIEVDEQDNPKTIDVYAVKTKGIYPRMAFPSIDYYWQSWD